MNSLTFSYFALLVGSALAQTVVQGPGRPSGLGISNGTQPGNWTNGSNGSHPGGPVDPPHSSSSEVHHPWGPQDGLHGGFSDPGVHLSGQGLHGPGFGGPGFGGPRPHGFGGPGPHHGAEMDGAVSHAILRQILGGKAVKVKVQKESKITYEKESDESGSSSSSEEQHGPPQHGPHGPPKAVKMGGGIGPGRAGVFGGLGGPVFGPYTHNGASSNPKGMVLGKWGWEHPDLLGG